MRGSSYISLPKKITKFNVRSYQSQNLDDNECFRWFHNRKLNPQKVHPERIKLSDKESVKKLDYCGISFPIQYKD